MSSSKITIAGAEKWFNDHESSLFAESTFPAGISKDLIVDAVIMRGGEFEVLYSDLDFMQAATTRWAQRWSRTFTKWYEALQIEYDPLYNYDRTEEWTTIDDGSDLTTRNLATSGNRTTETDSTGSSTDTGSGTSTDTVSAYNTNTFQNDRKNDSTSTGTTSTTTDQTQTETTGGTDTGTVKTDHDNTNTRTGRAFGNIGVTTSQQMLTAQLEVVEWNLYEHIADIYLNDFAIPVY